METNGRPNRPTPDDSSTEPKHNGSLPDELFRATGGRHKIGHVDPDCKHLNRASNFRTVPTEYLRRAGGRMCAGCSDGRDL